MPGSRRFARIRVWQTGKLLALLAPDPEIPMLIKLISMMLEFSSVMLEVNSMMITLISMTLKLIFMIRCK